MVKERRKTSGAAQQDRLANAMIPLVPEILPDLTNKHIFMSSGLYDPVVPNQEAERLFGLFKKTGTKVSLYWQNSGHDLTIEDIQKAKEWLLTCILLFPSQVK